MTTSLSTEFMSGGFSIQRNEMVSMQQQKHQQKFQFLNSFNQTFTRLGRPAQGEFDRISPYSLSSQRRQFIGGTVTTVTSPLTQTYRNGNQPASLGGITYTNTGGIESISVLSGGLGYAPSTSFNVTIRGGQPATGAFKQATATATTDGSGRVVSVDVSISGQGYDPSTNPTTAVVDESPAKNQFFVSFYDGVGAVTGVETDSGTAGHRGGVYLVTPTSIAVGNDPDGVANATSGTGGSFQVFVDLAGNVTKVVPLTFGQDYLIGNEITIAEAQLGNIGGSAPDLVIKVSSVVDADQLALDYGTVTWRSESFSVGDTVVLEYFVDTIKDPKAQNGVLRTLATDLCLHPYGNYYSSAWTSVQQQNATLTWAAAPTVGSGAADGTFTLTDISGKTLVGDFDNATTANPVAGGLTTADVGKRIIEPNGKGAALISAVDDATGVVTVKLDSATEDSIDVNAFDSTTKTVYVKGEWRIAINKSDFESQPYNIIYPFQDADASEPIPIAVNGQQDHRAVKECLNRIGDMFVVESEKATDLLSSKADVNSATVAIPSTVSLTQPVKDARKPQKWRMRFFYDRRDEYLYVNIATALQIKDNGDLTKGQGRDGIKQAVFRQPGELSEIYYNFSNDTNKAKSGWFRRQGKTTDDIESGYPLAYRLTCTDHGTGLFLFDQASVDQDDDYAWFVVQRHVNNVSGRIEFEDGKSPVHCLYSPSTRPEETSNYNVGFFAEVSEDFDTATGQTTITSKALDELQVFDVNGRQLKAGLPVEQSILTDSNPIEVKSNLAYSGGAGYKNTSATAGIPLTDAGSLGTNSTTGYTVINDQAKLPSIIAANYSEIAASNVIGNFASTTPDISQRTEFPLNYGSAYGTSFVPVGQRITAFDNTVASRTATTDVHSSTTTAVGDDGSFTTGGLANFNAARNQMQGPARLGLSVYRVRHRSSTGVDTYLDPRTDVKILDKTELAPAASPSGDARELPIVSSVSLFTPTSPEALTLVASRRVQLVHYTLMTATVDAGGNSISAVAATPAAFTPIPATSADAEIVGLPQHSQRGATSGFLTDYADQAGAAAAAGAKKGFETHTGGSADVYTMWTTPGTGAISMKVGDIVTTAAQAAIVETSGALNASATCKAMRIEAVIDTFPEDDTFIYEYAWNGAGFDNQYTNFFGRSGTASNPLFEINRLKVFVDGSEADAAVLGQNYTINADGNVEFGTTNVSLEYFGVEKPMYAYSLTDDTWTFNQPIENGTVVKLSYENYNDVEERDTGKSTYLVSVPEDRDIPSIWNDIHKVAKGIYRFVVRENDVFKPWDYHVSAVIPQVDSPACINPVEQLSITQDKTVIFNFPTPLASQRFIYSDAEMDLICVAGADSSTQGGIIKTSATKYDLDSAQESTLETGHTPGSEHVSSNGDKLNFRQPYDWHNAKQGAAAATATTAFRDGADALDTTTNATHRTYVGMMSTKPFGNGMRIFLLTRGGPIRPQYSDYTPRDIAAISDNTFS